MRLYITSDLHYGVKDAGDRATEALAARVCREPLDGLILIGDLGRDPETLAACLGLFQQFSGFKLALPGNHDVWIQGWPTEDSWAIHETLLPAALRAAGFHPLHLAPFVEGGVAVVGSMGWYDYSFRDEELGIALEHYERKTPPGRSAPIWNDARWARFPLDDVALTALLADRLAEQLVATRSARQVIGAVHHCATKALLVHPRFLVPTMWRFANTFLGAERFAEVFARDGRARHVFCGHIHRSKTVRQGALTYTSIGSDYVEKELLSVSADGIEGRWSFKS